MTDVQVVAKYVRRARLEDLSDKALEQLKIRVLDTIGAFAAVSIGRRARARLTGGATSESGA